MNIARNGNKNNHNIYIFYKNNNTKLVLQFDN